MNFSGQKTNWSWSCQMQESSRQWQAAPIFSGWNRSRVSYPHPSVGRTLVHQIWYLPTSWLSAQAVCCSFKYQISPINLRDTSHLYQIKVTPWETEATLQWIICFLSCQFVTGKAYNKTDESSNHNFSPMLEVHLTIWTPFGVHSYPAKARIELLSFHF